MFALCFHLLTFSLTGFKVGMFCIFLYPFIFALVVIICSYILSGLPCFAHPRHL
ncbi:hypothetical protein Lalb_Chr04g0264421 [Lupinus albus]|uniref:Uncharacterized protein n=1 Tax=Lupinus albus TaxID=3870 RepID=A0A6A4QPH3_LUPAL|nr:hypothetical protein Lalb_Chr04g0264421 [Lupinus albus]